MQMLPDVRKVNQPWITQGSNMWIQISAEELATFGGGARGCVCVREGRAWGRAGIPEG